MLAPLKLWALLWCPQSSEALQLHSVHSNRPGLIQGYVRTAENTQRLTKNREGVIKLVVIP